jgi:O-antigen/teichoic acid export membrane protein
MTNTTEGLRQINIRKAYQSLREHLRVPLYANAYALIVNQVLTAGLGVVYWIVAARLYPTDVVGENSAVLSTILFLAMLSELTFKAGATRFIPRAGRNVRKMLTGALLINLAAAFVVGLFVVTVGKRFSLTAGLMESIDFWPGWLVLGGMLWCVFYVLDGILTGFRQAKWVAVKNTTHSIIKLILLFVFARMAFEYGIVLSWFSPVIFFVIIIYILVFWVLIPRTSFGEGAQVRPITRQEVVRSISGDYVGSLLVETCIRMMPLLVLQQLGSQSTAYYYQAWTVASPIYMVASSMIHSFEVESSANIGELPKISRRILRQMLLLIVPGVFVVFFGAYYIMMLFGSSYAAESTRLLQWLVLATLPLIINYWFLGYSRVTGNGKSIVAVQGVTSVVALTASALWISKAGITAIGVAWFTAQCLIAIPVLIKGAPILFKRQKQETASGQFKLNSTLRRVDWRFLFPLARREKAICLSSDHDLKEAVSSFMAGVDGDLSLSGPGAYDLAVAVNPSKEMLRTAAASLAKDGHVYVEWSAWRQGGKRGILRHMHAAGFASVKLYAPFPNPVYPRAWIPLDAPDAPVQHIAGWLFPGDGSFHRLGQWTVKALLRLALRTGLMPSVSAVAARDTLQITDTFSQIRQEWLNSSPEISPDRLSYLVQTPGTSAANKIVFLVFQDQEPHPKWVVKIPRLPSGIPSLESEWDLLNELRRASQTTQMTLIVPEPVFQFDCNGVSAFGQTAMTGIPLQQTLQSNDLREIALQLTRWQITLAQLSRGWTHGISSREWIENLFADIKFELGSHTELSEILERTHHVISRTGDLPLNCLHNDFTVWNARQVDDRLAVFDWTDAYRSGPPLLDLVYGLASMFFLHENAWDSPEKSCKVYDDLLDASTPKGAIFNMCIQLYADQVGLGYAQIAPLRLLTWVLNVSFDLQYRRQELGSVPHPYDSMYFSLWKTELEWQKQFENNYLPLARTAGNPA